MNKQLMRKAGFNKEVDAVIGGTCPICGDLVNVKDFTDPLSTKEFVISGMCQVCQDEFFKAPGC